MTQGWWRMASPCARHRRPPFSRAGAASRLPIAISSRMLVAQKLPAIGRLTPLPPTRDRAYRPSMTDRRPSACDGLRRIPVRRCGSNRLWPPLATAFACVLASCATNREFAPRENSNGTSPTGRPAAVYSLLGPAGTASPGEVRVWSEGAVRGASSENSTSETTWIAIAFELENNSDQPIELDVQSMRIAALDTGTGHLEDLTPVETRGETIAVPGRTSRSEFRFSPGDAVMPRDVAGFEVRWLVHIGPASFRQATPFAPFVPDVPAYWDTWPYWGFGLHWHRCR